MFHTLYTNFVLKSIQDRLLKTGKTQCRAIICFLYCLFKCGKHKRLLPLQDASVYHIIITSCVLYSRIANNHMTVYYIRATMFHIYLSLSQLLLSL